MSTLGTADHPLRVAIIGAGPAGFYAAGHLLKQSNLTVSVDLFDRLPSPYGLVRLGVAPDHEKIRNVIRVYQKTAAHPRFRFFGNVELGRHLHMADLEAHYHQVVYTTGAQVDRRLGIPGEDLQGSHSATAFVAWYNGHPDYRHLSFDLSQERVAVIGVGNVAIDVARILCRPVEELAQTDMADYAVEALRQSKVREVYMLGRRGPAQAAFTNPEIKEMGELSNTDVILSQEEATLDPHSAALLAGEPSRMLQKKVDYLHMLAHRAPAGAQRRLILRFLVSPTALLDDGTGHVGGLKIVRNVLQATASGRLRPQPTDHTETLPVSLVFRSIGYRGVALPGVPFREDWGTIPHDSGRVLDAPDGQPLLGHYTAGWIKRGPSGVIGTNKADAVETVGAMLADLEADQTMQPTATAPSAIDQLLRQRQPQLFTFADWTKLDDLETARGEAAGRPRVKFTSREEMWASLQANSAIS